MFTFLDKNHIDTLICGQVDEPQLARPSHVRVIPGRQVDRQDVEPSPDQTSVLVVDWMKILFGDVFVQHRIDLDQSEAQLPLRVFELQ